VANVVPKERSIGDRWCEGCLTGPGQWYQCRLPTKFKGMILVLEFRNSYHQWIRLCLASKVEQHHDEHRARNDLETSGPVRSAPPVNSREFLTWHRVALNRRMPIHYTSAIPDNWDRARPLLLNWHVLAVTQSCHFRL